MVFPAVYNALHVRRGDKKSLLKVLAATLLWNVALLLALWFAVKDWSKGYQHFDKETGKINFPNPNASTPSDIEEAQLNNGVILGWYLFGPFWWHYFIAGATAAFVYDAYRPAEKHSAWVWGWIADAITVFMIGVTIGHICQGKRPHGGGLGEYNRPDQLSLDGFPMRPLEADTYVDNLAVARIWDNIWGRLFAPITTLWIYAISTGRGATASFFGSSFVSETLAPHSYNAFLFHQMIGQWYFAATREGLWWNWWRFRKTQYWFSPNPVPVEWYEYFFLVTLVVLFSKVMNNIEPWLSEQWNKFRSWVSGGEKDEEDGPSVDIVIELIEHMTGIEAQPSWELEECGLASIGMPMLVGLLNKRFSRHGHHTHITVVDLMGADKIEEIAVVVDEAIKEAALDV